MDSFLHFEHYLVSVLSSRSCPGCLPVISPVPDLMRFSGVGDLDLNSLSMAFPAQEWLRVNSWLETGGRLMPSGGGLENRTGASRLHFLGLRPRIRLSQKSEPSLEFSVVTVKILLCLMLELVFCPSKSLDWCISFLQSLTFVV